MLTALTRHIRRALARHRLQVSLRRIDGRSCPPAPVMPSLVGRASAEMRRAAVRVEVAS
jgi:hypothetical protein